jgi:hypothetical protein
MDETDRKGPYRHSWWRILLIVFTVAAFIVTCVFNGLGSTGPNSMNIFTIFVLFNHQPLSLDIFNQQTGKVSDQNPTDFTPAGKFINLTKIQLGISSKQGWTFAIWGVIYFWQAAWLIYALSRIPRKSNAGYLYIAPNTLHFSIFIFYIINMGLNIGWLIIWDRQYFGVS